MRPGVEKDGTKQVTDGFSVIKSWSPQSFKQTVLEAAFGNKVYLRAGAPTTFVPSGIAYTDINESENPFSPLYLFLLYKAEIDDEERLDTRAHADARKNAEHFVGWY